MRRRVVLLCLTLLAAALVSGVRAPTAPAAAAQVPWVGMMADGPMIDPAATAYDDQWAKIRAAHVGFVRIAFYWSQLEPADGRFDFTATDALVAKAAAQGLAVLPVVLRTPGWAAKDPDALGSPPRHPEDVAPLMTALIGRYGPAGTFWTDYPQLARLPLREWQIYNEPNLPEYWNERRWAPGYVRLLEVAHRAIARADPGARTILAGLPNKSWVALRRIYAAGGRDAFDAAALHVYTADARSVAKIVRYARRVMTRNGDARKPIWLTEFTWPSSHGRRPDTSPWETTEAGQAARVRTGLPRLARLRQRLHLEKVVWYSWMTVEDHATWQAYSGLMRVRAGKLVATPALAAFTAALSRLA